MKKSCEEFIYLLRCVLRGESAADFACDDIDSLIEIAQDHNMLNLLYYALADNASLEQRQAEQLKKGHDLAVYKCAHQRMAQRELCELFGGAGIKYMLLKGSAVTQLYPSDDMREMADIDILVESRQLNAVRGVLTAAGYRFEGHKGNHDVYRKAPAVAVEVHETMLNHSRETGLEPFFADPWSMSRSDGCAHRLTVDDNYIFLMGHLLGHFQQEGVGVRAVMDVALYLEHYGGELDRGYIDGVFERMGVAEIMGNLEALARLWLHGGSGSALLDEMGEYVFASGSYGRVGNMILYLADEDSGKAGSALRAFRRKLFIPADEMRRRSRLASHCALLLPLSYAARALGILVGRFGELRWWIGGVRTVDAQRVKRYKEMMKRFGLG